MYAHEQLPDQLMHEDPAGVAGAQVTGGIRTSQRHSALHVCISFDIRCICEYAQTLRSIPINFDCPKQIDILLFPKQTRLRSLLVWNFRFPEVNLVQEAGAWCALTLPRASRTTLP